MPHLIPIDVPEPDPLIMTALFDAQSYTRLDGLRRHHFPPGLNRVPAHATLFHHLPGADIRGISDRVATTCAEAEPLVFTCPATRFLGRGVALEIACPGLVALRGGFASAWRGGLTAQDRQGYRPHVTILNKVGPEAAREARRQLDALLPMSGTIEGLILWHYRGGPWEEAGRFIFTGA